MWRGNMIPKKNVVSVRGMLMIKMLSSAHSIFIIIVYEYRAYMRREANNEFKCVDYY